MVRLTLQAHRLVVVPPSNFDIARFVLPAIEKYNVDWLAMGGSTYLSLHDRCIAFLLFLDQRHHTWSWGLPRQRASRDSACWTATRADFPQLGPDHCVTGSFQLRLLAEGEEPEDTVPRVDGIHFVQVMTNGSGSIHSFVRVAERLAALPAQTIINDDLAQLQKACGRRVLNV